jgi:DNA-binding transcriptional LysR family regulator
MRNLFELLEAVERLGSLTRAAQELGVSQPYASQLLQKAETKYQLLLVDRATLPARLTEAGHLVTRTEEKVRALRRRCEEELQDLEEGVRGRLVIGASHYRERFFLARVLPEYRKLFPNVDVELVEGTTQELEELCEAGQTDISLLIAPVHSKHLESVDLYNERLFIAAQKGTSVLRGVHDLDGAPFIIMKKGQRMRTLYEELCRQNRVRPRIVLESESPESALSLSSVGMGATITTETLLKRSNVPGELTAVELPHAQRTVVACWNTANYLSKANLEMVKCMQRVGAEEFGNG